ncbi:MAG: hypothetical protein AB1540_09920 [Bdellovibrionota bacterium]
MTKKYSTRGIVFWFTLLGFSAHAAPNTSEIEVMQASATLQYHSKQHALCKTTIQKILQQDPNNINALELLALTQRALNEEEEAAKTYVRLAQVGPPPKKAAYRFELGSLRYKQKKFPQARRHFELAAKGNFNPGTSHFFLGVMNFSSKAWRKARHHFTASLTYSDGQSMAPVTRYYLANTYTQLGKTESAARNYYTSTKEIDEKATTSNQGIDSLTGDVRKNALKELKNLDQNQSFATLSMLSQWDSNVQTNPSDVNNPVAASSQRSLKAVFSAALGHSTSPTRTLQITPSYRFFTNYNLHYLATDFNFMSHTPGVYILYKPYTRFSGGIKAEGTFSMKNTLTETDDRRAMKYRKFSLTGDIGPVAKYELTPRIILGAETTWRPKKFYQDPLTGDTRRTGGGVFGRLSSEFISEFNWWNPLLYFSYEWDHPAGKNFRYRAIGAGVSNPVPITDKFTVTGVFDLLGSDYYETKNPKRDDFLLSYRAVASYLINNNWSATADVGYVDNQSTVLTSFKYNRILVSGGATYSF